MSCGSAVTDNMTKPQSVPLGGVNPPQFQALSQDATLVSVGIGGNDADLVGIAESCISYDALVPTGSPCRDHYTVNGRDTAAAGVDAIAPKIAAVLSGIHARSPHARTLLVGYPAVLPLSGPGCWPIVPLSSGDVPWFRSLLVRINTVLAAQAKANGAGYVDTYTGSEGHDVCTLPGTRWFEGLVPTSPAFPLHPNALGEASMARSVLSVVSHPTPVSAVSAPSAHGAPRLRITGWRFRGAKLIVRGTIRLSYRGRVLATFVAGAERRISARASVTVSRGHWRVTLKLPGNGRAIPRGRITASSRAQDGLRGGIARARTRAT